MKTVFPATFFIIVLAISVCCSRKEKLIDLAASPEKIELFGKGIVSTNMNERDIAISPDGDEIVFTLNDYKSTIRCLVGIKKNSNKWEKKDIISFSGQYFDIEPFFSPDGTKLYFASNRPIDSDTVRNDYNIWVAERTSDGWKEPEPLPSIINTGNDEYFPSVGKNGNLYFTAARKNGIGSEDIFMSQYTKGNYSEPVPLDTNINSQTYEFNAFIHPDEDLIIFSSFGRKDDMGGGDLYYSRKDMEGNWLPAVNMGPAINSPSLDYCPFIDVPRGNFYFSSDRKPAATKKMQNVEEIEFLSSEILNGMGNIYRVSLKNIDMQ